MERALERLDREALDAAVMLVASAIGELAREAAEAAAAIDDVYDETGGHTGRWRSHPGRPMARWLSCWLKPKTTEPTPSLPLGPLAALCTRAAGPWGVAGATYNIL